MPLKTEFQLVQHRLANYPAGGERPTVGQPICECSRLSADCNDWTLAKLFPQRTDYPGASWRLGDFRGLDSPGWRGCRRLRVEHGALDKTSSLGDGYHERASWPTFRRARPRRRWLRRWRRHGLLWPTHDLNTEIEQLIVSEVNRQISQ